MDTREVVMAFSAELRALELEREAELLASAERATDDWWISSLELPAQPLIAELRAFFGCRADDPDRLETNIGLKAAYWERNSRGVARSQALSLIRRAAVLTRAGCDAPPIETARMNVSLPHPVTGKLHTESVIFGRDWSSRAWVSTPIFAARRSAKGKWYRRSMVIPDIGDTRIPLANLATNACGQPARIKSWYQMVPPEQRALIDNDFADRLGVPRTEMLARAVAIARLRQAVG